MADYRAVSAGPDLIGAVYFAGRQWTSNTGQEVTMHSNCKRLCAAVSAIAILFIANPASADLYSATNSYQNHDFGTAFEQFKELADLGQPQAQFDLAVMYYHGDGVPVSLTYAHAWAALAGENGEPKGSALAAELEPQLTPNSLRFSADLQAQHSQATLNKRLLPNILKGREYEDRDPVRPSKPYIPDYPPAAQLKGIQGEVYVEFVVAPDGHPRVPRILYALPKGYFEAAVRDSVMRSVYLPARTNGEPIATTVSIFYNFEVPSVTLRDYGNLASRVEKTKKEAEAGDPSAQMLYGMMISGLPQLKQARDQALPWFLKAAQAGAPYAQYQVGTGLLRGRGCQCDNTKAEIWLEKAAQADQPDAQVSLAELLLKERPNREAIAGALIWLERAAKQGNVSAKLFLSAVLAASPLPDVHNPARALNLTDSLEHEYKDDPSFWEIRAAANASEGNFRAAVKAEAQAIAAATRLGWNMEPLERRASLYSSQQSWSGNLLEF